MKTCPYCAEQVQEMAVVCRFCGRVVAPDEWLAFADKLRGLSPALQERELLNLNAEQRAVFDALWSAQGNKPFAGREELFRRREANRRQNRGWLLYFGGAFLLLFLLSAVMENRNGKGSDQRKTTGAATSTSPPSSSSRAPVAAQKQAAGPRAAPRAPQSRGSLSRGELKELTATILNLNGLLCAEVVRIQPLALEGKFEVTCVAYRGGSAEKTYILDANRGTAFEP